MDLISLLELSISIAVALIIGLVIGGWIILKLLRIFVLTVMADQRVDAIVRLAQSFGGRRGKLKWEDLAVQAGQGFLSRMFGGMGGLPPSQPPSQ